jgi:hypothetical protein
MNASEPQPSLELQFAVSEHMEFYRNFGNGLMHAKHMNGLFDS